MLLPAIIAPAEAAAESPRAGDAYEISRTLDTEQKSEGSEGSTHDRDRIVERVIAVHPDSVELEYDLPSATDREERDRQWQLPARLLKPAQGQWRLLNRAELEARRDAWLRRGKMTRERCGQMIFTWNAFRIECDPESVFELLRPFDLGAAELKAGAAYRDRAARAPGVLTKTATGYFVRMEVDPDFVRHRRAENDLVVAEIMGKPITLDKALAVRSKEEIAGTVTVSFELDRTGDLRRRTIVTRLEIKRADGKSETDTATEIVERHRLGAAEPRRSERRPPTPSSRRPGSMAMSSSINPLPAPSRRR